ncbi:hypothetical protein [Maribellus mangrovi]|uniref:hypothetical protein n=1 Tax=Maribellus mangrovi TaxID=3133146 RepID=UPI0030ED2F15
MGKNISFELLLGELSSELVKLPLDSVDAAILSGLKRILEFFDVYLRHLGKFTKDQSKIIVPYFYSRPEIEIPQITDLVVGYLSFVFESIKNDEKIAVQHLSELPEHTKHDREVLAKMGIKSMLVLLLKIEKFVQYGLSLSTVRKHHEWDKQTINRIQIHRNILTNVIQRKLALKQIPEEKEWSEVVMEGMLQITYVLDELRKGCVIKTLRI